MCARIGICLFSALLFASLATDAIAEKRVALVIGNSNYVNVQTLPNPANDAGAFSVLLEGAGFEVVETRNDLGNVEMRRVIRDFSEKTRNADMAVVYYAGHGIEVDGANFLVPTDARLERDIDVEDEAIALDRILKMLEPAKKLRLVILDACRDNPFVRTMKRTMASRSVGRGLASIEPPTSDTLIAFAAKAGSIAADGDGMHSPFTAALLKHIMTPGLDLRLVFGRVRDDVIKNTANRQEPFVYGSLGGSNVALVPGTVPAAPVSGLAALPSAAPIAVAPVPSTNSAWRDYELAAQINNKEVWDAYLESYPTGFYANLARAQRAKLLPMAPAGPAVQPAVPTGTTLAAVTPAVTPPAAAATPPAVKPKHAKKKEKEKRRATRSVRGGDSEARGGNASNPHCSTIRHAIRAAKSAGFVDTHGLMAGASRYCGGRG
jgi:hypothetical protein